MIFVVDASVAAKWFVREAYRENARRLLDHAQRLQAPDLIIAEVANIAWKKHTRGQITRMQAEAMAAVVFRYIPTLHASSELAGRALQIALAIDHPVYDCLYLACAQTVGGIVITADDMLCRAAEATAPPRLVHHLKDIDALLGADDPRPPGAR